MKTSSELTSSTAGWVDGRFVRFWLEVCGRKDELIHDHVHTKRKQMEGDTSKTHTELQLTLAFIHC